MIVIQTKIFPYRCCFSMYILLLFIFDEQSCYPHNCFVAHRERKSQAKRLYTRYNLLIAAFFTNFETHLNLLGDALAHSNTCYDNKI